MAEEKRTRANGRASRQAIVSAAFDVFAERGFRGTTLLAVAKRVGMTQPGLLHHFATKEELLLEVVRSREEVTTRDMTPHLTPESLDIKAAIETLGRLNQREAVEQLLLTTLSAEAVPVEHPLHVHFVGRYREYRDRLAAALERAQRHGAVRPDLDTGAVAREIIATLDGLRLQWLLDPEQVELEGALSAFAARTAREIATA